MFCDSSTSMLGIMSLPSSNLISYVDFSSCPLYSGVMNFVIFVIFFPKIALILSTCTSAPSLTTELMPSPRTSPIDMLRALSSVRWYQDAGFGLASAWKSLQMRMASAISQSMNPATTIWLAMDMQ